MKKLNLLNQRFGRLTVIREDGVMYGRRVAWLCQCDCGNTKTVPGQALRSGATQSCGCLRDEETGARSRTHGQTGNWRTKTPKSKEYRAWCHAKARCHSKTDAKYPIYGGRGIVMCERWRDSFEAFLADVRPAPSPSHTIDRIDSNGNYEPSNVRWATPKEQANNVRKNVRMPTGETLKQFAERTGENYKALHARLRGKRKV